MFLWLQLMMLLTIWSWTMTAWRNEMIRVSLCGKCCLGDFSLRYTIKRMSDARVLIKQIAFGCCYLLFVSHGPLSPNHNFTACLLFQLFGCHTSWTQNPAHKVKLKRRKKMCQKYDHLEDALICMSDILKKILRVLSGYIFVNDSLE